MRDKFPNEVKEVRTPNAKMCEMEFLSQFRAKTDTLVMCRSTLMEIKVAMSGLPSVLLEFTRSFNEIAHNPPTPPPPHTIIRN